MPCYQIAKSNTANTRANIHVGRAFPNSRGELIEQHFDMVHERELDGLCKPSISTNEREEVRRGSGEGGGREATCEMKRRGTLADSPAVNPTSPATRWRDADHRTIVKQAAERWTHHAREAPPRSI